MFLRHSCTSGWFYQGHATTYVFNTYFQGKRWIWVTYRLIWSAPFRSPYRQRWLLDSSRRHQRLCSSGWTWTFPTRPTRNQTRHRGMGGKICKRSRSRCRCFLLSKLIEIKVDSNMFISTRSMVYKGQFWDLRLFREFLRAMSRFLEMLKGHLKWQFARVIHAVWFIRRVGI